MLFNSYVFVFLFLPAVLLFYFNLRSHRVRLVMLLGASYLFYGFWNYKFIPLLLFSTLLDFWLGIKIYEAKDARRKKLLLILSLIVNLGVLGFFKYFNFFADNLYTVATWFSPNLMHPPRLDVVLPIGISFYTFISLSYTIDVYWGRSKPHREFFSYAGFVAFFPHLIAGPLIRHDELVEQLEDPTRARFKSENFSQGLYYFVLGLSKKILIADWLSIGVDTALKSLPQLSSFEAWLCALGYTFQLYFDFSAYSDMAVGIAKMMNIEFPQNFRSPYKAQSVTEFWQRWHITLSRWLRDYLYIPLGGNRFGEGKTYRNLILTMLIGGLWHGASWVFVIWGAYHGLLLAIERRFGTGKLPSVLMRLRTFFLVLIGWIFFRSPDLPFAMTWIGRLFSRPEFSVLHFDISFRDRFFLALLVAMAISWGSKNLFEMNLPAHFQKRFAWILALLFLVCLTFFGKESPFLYFQF